MNPCDGPERALAPVGSCRGEARGRGGRVVQLRQVAGLAEVELRDSPARLHHHWLAGRLPEAAAHVRPPAVLEEHRPVGPRGPPRSARPVMRTARGGAEGPRGAGAGPRLEGRRRAGRVAEARRRRVVEARADARAREEAEVGAGVGADVAALAGGVGVAVGWELRRRGRADQVRVPAEQVPRREGTLRVPAPRRDSNGPRPGIGSEGGDGGVAGSWGARHPVTWM
jgi:hypothetical protein